MLKQKLSRLALARTPHLAPYISHLLHFQAALAAGTSVFAKQHENALAAAAAASAAKKQAGVARSRKWKLETEAAAARHRAVMAQADAVRTVASAAASMRAAADKEQASDAAAAAAAKLAAAASKASRSSLPVAVSHPAYERVLKAAERRELAAAAAAKQAAAAAKQASPTDAAAAAAEVTVSGDDAARLSSISKTEAVAKAAVVSALAADASAKSAMSGATAARMGAAKLSASADFVRYVAQTAARERAAAAAEKAAAAAAKATAAAVVQSKANLADARALKLKQLKVSLQRTMLYDADVSEICNRAAAAALVPVFGVSVIILQAHMRGFQAKLGEDAKCVLLLLPPPPSPFGFLNIFISFVDQLHEARSRDAAVAAAAAKDNSKDRFAAARAMSLRRLQVARKGFFYMSGGGDVMWACRCAVVMICAAVTHSAVRAVGVAIES